MISVSGCWVLVIVLNHVKKKTSGEKRVVSLHERKNVPQIRMLSEGLKAFTAAPVNSEGLVVALNSSGPIMHCILMSVLGGYSSHSDITGLQLCLWPPCALITSGFVSLCVCVPPGYAAQKLSESQWEREGLKSHRSTAAFPRPPQQQQQQQHLHCGAMSNPSASKKITDAVEAVIQSVSESESVHGRLINDTALTVNVRLQSFDVPRRRVLPRSKTFS